MPRCTAVSSGINRGSVRLCLECLSRRLQVPKRTMYSSLGENSLADEAD